jgi:hypothetical protein
MKYIAIIIALALIGCHPMQQPTQHKVDPTDLPSDEYSSIKTAPDTSATAEVKTELEPGASLLQEKQRAFRAYQAAVKAYDDYQRVHKHHVDAGVDLNKL